MRRGGPTDRSPFASTRIAETVDVTRKMAEDGHAADDAARW